MRALILSDTHGLLRPEVLALVAQADLVIHAGDVGRPEVLDDIRRAAHAPVHVVRGNVDTAPPLSALPATELIEAGGRSLYLLHNLDHLDLSPQAAGIDAVVFGHTHRPEERRENGVLYLNPGSVGPRRFSLPVVCAWLDLADDLQVTPVELG
ncbi:metallophosphoesterase family protein [Deinococcus radiophilus]|uniref:Phosphoesterase n=1 Tax=Deinococcus radiophilus TaxID=32062 RepID=A0A431VN97_9DEIO|nr:metallophosphoesterase family protein [Deinococcus radiophilus]RTR23829.1 metallophosphoesterase [Deinococcus radiophilus]UFA50456.1 metallophosphatase family protein [Deinococcus radiophilus]